jgi:hypothetical protein
MKKLKQSNPYSCWPACVASWLSLDSVPIGWELKSPTQSAFDESSAKIEDFLSAHGKTFAFFGSESYDLPVNSPVIISYDKQKGVPHAVIAKTIIQDDGSIAFEVLHDPGHKKADEQVKFVDVKSLCIIYDKPELN